MIGTVPAPGDVVKAEVDFTTRTATAYINGVSVASLDLSAQTWYTADGSLA